MEAQQVYISFESQDYKLNKTSLLMCKAELIQLQKRLTNLHAIRSYKKRLLTTIINLTSSAEFSVQKLDDKMPDPAMPHHLKKSLNKKVSKDKPGAHIQKKEMPVKVEFDVESLDKELLELNKRIKELS